MAKVALVGSVMPFLLKTASKLNGAPVALFDGMLAACHAIGAFSEADFRDDLKKITVPTLVIHGSDDRIVPIEISGEITAKMVTNAKLIVYEGGSHGLLVTQKDRLNTDLSAYLNAGACTRSGMPGLVSQGGPGSPTRKSNARERIGRVPSANTEWSRRQG